MQHKLVLLAAVALLGLLAAPITAEAKPGIQRAHVKQSVQPRKPALRHRLRRHRVKHPRYVRMAEAGGSYLPHPSGCPARAFCACGAAFEIFGIARRDLWPANAWYRFPRAAPGYHKVAVRPHHVFVLREQIEGTRWLTADYNSGGHLSRLHVRDIRGYTIVDPHAIRMASR